MPLPPQFNLYSGTGSKELDLREELKRTLFGAIDEVAKGRIGLLRKMRLDNENQPIKCTCRDKVTTEPDRDYYCRTCLGHGWLWDETKIVYYKNDKLSLSRDNVDFYLEYDENITKIDFIVEVNTDSDGKLIYPYERTEYYEVMDADAFRADNGRIEFWHVKAKRRRGWSVHYGVKHRQYGV